MPGGPWRTNLAAFLVFVAALVAVLVIPIVRFWPGH